MKMTKTMRAMGAAAVLAAFAGAAGSAQAGVSTVNFQSGNSIEETGVTFTGSMAYDDSANLLTVNLSNTSAFQSVITGFFFNISGNAAAGYSAVDNAGTSGVNEGSFGFATSLSPFGTWDAGAFLQNLSQQQVRGIDEGETGTFQFNISGADKDALEAMDFFTDTNSGGGLTGAFAVRYQSVGLDANASDKVMGLLIDDETPGPPAEIPLPPAAWAALATMGITGLGSLRGRLRRPV